ncbi:DUF3352 domain-containing protein [Pseudanabaena yagii]|uniref:DUF3352 domain-containing protein n=1 Tax=Pseudanabaena yagii GIHE-NHR1 TaxID=2722753 RepID=A0ABX1LWZ7_9CYAN|nr:DUF3352 domain-containing protein [Pseudanabaena yagii]NMF59289.1 DUF3352 domain-containing protein [Pseudanabaena yagii GIHE-NHR1]
MKIKPVFAGIAVLGALLLVLSLTTIAKVFAANPRDLLAGVKTQPQAVQLLPKRSPLFVSFLANPEKLGLFTQLAAKPSDRGDVRHELANLKQQLQQNWLLDYERDIQPWLDQEITLAVTDVDLDHQSANGLQIGYLLALKAKDVDLAKTTIDAFWQELAVNGSDLGFEQYQGVSILNTSFAENRPAIAGTILDKFVLFANDVRVLRQAIDDLKDPSLALPSLEHYRDRLAQINKGKIAVAYANLGELGEDLPQASLLMSLGLDKAGIRAKTLWHEERSPQSVADVTEPNASAPSSLSKPATKPSSKSSTNIATALPSGNAVIIGKNLGETLKGFQTSLPPEWLKVITKAIAPIPLNQDAVAWAQDDFAITLFPQRNAQPTITPDWLLVAKVNDAKASATAIASLDDLARKQLTVGEITLKNQPVTVWTKLSASLNTSSGSPNNADVSGQVVAVHAQTSNYIYLSNSLPSLELALTLKNNQAIASSQNFKTITAKLPRDYKAYGYLAQKVNLDWLETISSDIKIQEISSKISHSPLASIFKHIEMVGFASNSIPNNIENSELFVNLN